MNERCPECGGPVERGKLKNVETGLGIRIALPDSLEGIEGEIKGLDSAYLRSMKQGIIILRLFNGCAACGRKPIRAPDSEAFDRWVTEQRAMGKRQAFQQAAEMVEEAQYDAFDCEFKHYVKGRLVIALRKLAEESK